MSAQDEWAMLEAMGLPTGFGKKAKQVDQARVNQAIEDTRRKDPPPAKTTDPEATGTSSVQQAAGVSKLAASKSAPSTDAMQTDSARDEDNDSDSDDDDDEDEELADVIPITHQASLRDHSRTVAAISVDPAGARVATGGRDCLLKLWDFHGMDANCRPFRSIEPAEGNPIRDVQWSISGDQLLVASTTSQPKIYDRDGSEIAEFVKGDPYIRDLRNTKGHVAALTGGRWHPHDKGIFLTSSLDSTIRIWDVENTRKQKDVIAVKSKLPGGKTAITAAIFSPNADLIIGGGADGALRTWKSKGPFIMPTQSLENAHMSGSTITSIAMARTRPIIATRSTDDTLKTWDLRNFKKPISTVSNLSNFFEETNVIFSPDDRYVLTGTSVKRDAGQGQLCIYGSENLEEVARLDITGSSVVRLVWHARINQILAGCGDGSVQVLYEPRVSLAGIKNAIAKRPKTKAVDDLDLYSDDAARPIITPHALPMFKEDFPGMGKRKRERIRADPLKTKKPDLPLSGPGRGGKLGTSITQHIMRSVIKDTTRDEDPREAILKHAEAAKANPYWVAPAYKRTQPDPRLAQAVYEDEDEAERAAAKKRRQ
ncbi:hypothetical protein HDV00_009551 [Rhizophlyctis rosea]|nr:hypothetical protein HDV00_009551 [Rhizophlyctis rosea]